MNKKNIVYVSGNGNISMADFERYYAAPLRVLVSSEPETAFIVGDFRGTDTLTMELLKTLTPHVTVIHCGNKPRYIPDRFKTFVTAWTITGGFQNDLERDLYAIEQCTHFLAADFNSDEKRESGTAKNIRACLQRNKIRIAQE